MLVTSTIDVSNDLYASLICNGTEINFCNTGVEIVGGRETYYECYLRLSKDKIGGSEGTCKIKAMSARIMY